jgi:hypothetical protein
MLTGTKVVKVVAAFTVMVAGRLWAEAGEKAVPERRRPNSRLRAVGWNSGVVMEIPWFGWLQGPRPGNSGIDSTWSLFGNYPTVGRKNQTRVTFE